MILMKSALLTIILVTSIGFTIKGQNVRLGKVIVSPRVYANYHLNGSRLLHKTKYYNNGKGLNFYRPTVSVLLRKPGKRRAIEIEATTSIRREERKARYIKEQFLALRLEYGNYRKFYVLKKKFNYRYSISAQVFKSYDKSNWNVPAHSRIDREGVIFAFIPHIEIPFGQRIFVDINAPLFNCAFFKRSDRGWVSNQRTEYLVRFGFGVKL